MKRSNSIVGALLNLELNGGDTFLDDYFAMFPQYHGTPLIDAIWLLKAKEKELFNVIPFVAKSFRIVHHARLYLMDVLEGNY